MLGYSLSIQVVNCAVVPEPSERTTGVIGSLGKARPLLSLVIAGVVPVGDLAGEDLGDRLAGEAQVADQLVADLELVGERRAAGDDRQVGELAAVAVVGVAELVDARVGDLGDAEVGAFCAKFLRPLAGAAAVVGDLHAVGVDVGDPLLDDHLGPGRAGALDLGVRRTLGRRREVAVGGGVGAGDATRQQGQHQRGPGAG